MKKNLSFFAAVLLSATMMAADYMPTSVYRAGDLSTLGAAWSNKSQTANYFVSGDTTVFNAYLCYQSQGSGKQTWTGSIGGNSSSTNWDGIDCFRGNTAWGINNCAKTRSTYKYYYNVTNCIEVRALVNNTREVCEHYLKVYKIEGGQISATPIDSAINAENGLKVMTVSNLNAADTFQIVVLTNNNNNSQFYEIAFVNMAYAANVATLGSIAVGGSSIADFAADQLTYSVELPYGTTEAPEVTAVPTQSNETLVITQAATVPGTATIVATSADGNLSTTYSVHFVLGAPEKAIYELIMSNFYSAYQPAGQDTIFAHYLAGTTAPTILSSVLSAGASVDIAGDSLTITAADNSTAVYPFSLTSVEPYLAGNDTIFFDGNEAYVVCPYGFEADSIPNDEGGMKAGKNGYKFAKTDNDYSREWAGKTHVEIYLSDADSVLLIGGVNNRSIKVRVEDSIVVTGNLGLNKNLWVPVHRSEPFCLTIISNQSGGDGSIKGIFVAHMSGEGSGFTILQADQAPRKFFRNGQLLIEKAGILYDSTGRRLQ